MNKSMKGLSSLLLSGVALLGGMSPSFAAVQASVPLTVTLNVTSSCSFNLTAVTLNLGSAVAGGTAGTGANNQADTGPSGSALTVTCAAAQTGATVQISGTTGARTLTGPGGTVAYGLYEDTGYSVPWPTAGEVYNLAAGVATPVAIYAKASGPVPAFPGLYEDNQTITLNF